MKIATWNIERLKHIDRKAEIEALCKKSGADILVLTESDDRVNLEYDYSFHSKWLDVNPITGVTDNSFYLPPERRISIHTNNDPVKLHNTFDDRTALCVELVTERGNILVYGVIIGVLGNRHPSFNADLEQIAEDKKRLSSLGKPLIVCGDFNCTFCDNYYFTKNGREKLLQVFEECRMRIVTKDTPECIDHIAVSEDLISDMPRISEWNEDKALSDHKGIVVDIGK